MVFFTCSHCGESVKKPSVAKHYQTKCRNQTPFLTCVDCLKDFKGNEYEVHTKCFTEQERYSAKGSVPSSSSNKGERKQKAWSESVQGLLQSEELNNHEKNVLNSISKYENIPRKKVKFINFLKTIPSGKSYVKNTDLIDGLWEKLQNYFKEVNSGNEQKAEVNEPDGKTDKAEEKTDEAKEKTNNAEEKRDKKRKHNKIANNNNNNDSESEKAPESVPEKSDAKKKKKKKHSTEETMETVPEVVKEDKKSEITKLDDKEEPQSKKSKKSKQKSEIKENINGKEMEMEIDDKENIKNKKGFENGNSTEKNGKEVNGTGENASFNWNNTILDVLSKNTKNDKITVKKLQKKVLKKYCKTFQCETNEKIIKKFMKKLNKVNNVTVNGEYVCVSK